MTAEVVPPLFGRDVGFGDREKELPILKNLYGKVLEGKGQILFITGEAGIGKTRRARVQGIIRGFFLQTMFVKLQAHIEAAQLSEAENTHQQISQLATVIDEPWSTAVFIGQEASLQQATRR